MGIIKNKKAFTLAEMVAVIAILMFLALLSAPFVKGYIDDAYYGKAQVYMRELHEARLNFEKDFPGTRIDDTTGEQTPSSTCEINEIYQTGILKPKILEKCHYMKRMGEDLQERYTFLIGSNVQCTGCPEDGQVVAMLGTVNAGKYKGKCVCMDSSNTVFKVDPER